jgi:hypothetical protein
VNAADILRIRACQGQTLLQTSGFKCGKTAMVYPVTQYTDRQGVLYFQSITRFHGTVQAKCSIIHTHTKSKVFPASICIRFTSAQQHRERTCIVTFLLKSYNNGAKEGQKTVRQQLKVWFSLRRFSRIIH